MKKGEKKFPDNQTPLQALTAARALIEHPHNWVRGAWGDDAKHCMTSALSRSTSMNVGVWDAALGFLSNAVERQQGTSLAQWNDTHTHAEVLAAYDRAIASAAAEVVTEESAS